MPSEWVFGDHWVGEVEGWRCLFKCLVTCTQAGCPPLRVNDPALPGLPYLLCCACCAGWRWRPPTKENRSLPPCCATMRSLEATPPCVSGGRDALVCLPACPPACPPATGLLPVIGCCQAAAPAHSRANYLLARQRRHTYNKRNRRLECALTASMLCTLCLLWSVGCRHEELHRAAPPPAAAGGGARLHCPRLGSRGRRGGRGGG